jgi:hypothetical protein
MLPTHASGLPLAIADRLILSSQYICLGTWSKTLSLPIGLF